jgi:hypothetical protein
MTLDQYLTRARFDARQHGRRIAVMSAHRAARRDAIDALRNSEPDACDYFNAGDYDSRIDALEARYALLRDERVQTIAVMAHEPHNGSRAAMVRPTNISLAETVNATEVRVTPRWNLDRPSKVKWPTRWDGSCYSIQPDGTRARFNPATETDETTPRKQSATVDHAGDYGKMVALVGTTGDTYD